MKTLMFSFAIPTTINDDGSLDDGSGRRSAALAATFQLGPAWHCGPSAVFAKTTLPSEEAYRRVLAALDERDLLLMIELPNGSAAKFAGHHHDEEGFDEIFPAAEKVDHINLTPVQPEMSGYDPLNQHYDVSAFNAVHRLNQD